MNTTESEPLHSLSLRSFTDKLIYFFPYGHRAFFENRPPTRSLQKTKTNKKLLRGVSFFVCLFYSLPFVFTALRKLAETHRMAEPARAGSPEADPTTCKFKLLSVCISVIPIVSLRILFFSFPFFSSCLALFCIRAIVLWSGFVCSGLNCTQRLVSFSS